ncbi:hypothetical protein E6W39_05190 [Kitasatospora acidiphila]|uniref:Lipoprotein n=1 Tax=Kitasatospora acidiphila TaxID=2567942 RepID=A0A540VYG3_9ACTN|nr:hypothetical protein [Kitasatospora acidiphila]TQF01757.1 hypothetical protein E6W39_05190 [Kitasatospora acidiphila]
MHRAARRRSAVGATAALLLGLAATGCSSSPSRPSIPATPPQPQSLQADSVASQEFGLLAGGGWAQAWSLWDESGQQAISQADFVRLNTECRPAVGAPYAIDRSTTVDPTTVRVDWHRATTAGSNTMVYQAGRWHFVPDQGALADYRLGADQLLRRRRAAGACN